MAKVELSYSDLESLLIAMACRNETLNIIRDALPVTTGGGRRDILAAMIKSNEELQKRLYNALVRESGR